MPLVELFIAGAISSAAKKAGEKLVDAGCIQMEKRGWFNPSGWFSSPFERDIREYTKPGAFRRWFDDEGCRYITGNMAEYIYSNSDWILGEFDARYRVYYLPLEVIVLVYEFYALEVVRNRAEIRGVKSLLFAASAAEMTREKLEKSTTKSPILLGERHNDCYMAISCVNWSQYHHNYVFICRSNHNILNIIK